MSGFASISRSSLRRRALLTGTHIVLAALGYFLAFVLRFEFRIPAAELSRFVDTLAYLVLVRVVLLHRFRLDRGYWQHVGLRDLVHLTAATTLGTILFPVVLLVFDSVRGIPVSVLLLEWLLAIALMGGVRVSARLARERSHLVRAGRGKRTFIVGAGGAGEQLLRQILHDTKQTLEVVGLIDDDPAKRGRSLHGVPVLGGTQEMRGLAALHGACLALIAVPSATPEQLRRLVDCCTDADLEVKLLPPFKDLVSGDVRVSQVREVHIEDLLSREPVQLDMDAVEPDIAGRTVLVTGAGGSIGSELARQIAGYHPLRLILIERAESPLHYTHLDIAHRHPSVQVVAVLASVTNTSRLQQVFEAYRPDCVFHAAAYKHVPMLEWNVVEGVWNNVMGTLRVARCAARAHAKKFVLVSTDKAVNPASVLGATKLIAERIVLELPSLCASATDFRVVRFGNVLDSDGSVLPLFRRQLAAGGPLTVTHPEMRRYFMTIPEAVQLVLRAVALPEAAGRIAVLEMGTQVRILDLAEQLIRMAGLLPYEDVEITFTGLRPGEKLYEELVAPEEKAVATSVDKIRVVERNGRQGDALARRLRHLARVAAGRDEAALMRALSVLAPEYRPASVDTFLQRGVAGNGFLPWTVAGNGRHGSNGNGNGRPRRRPVRRREGIDAAMHDTPAP